MSCMLAIQRFFVDVVVVSSCLNDTPGSMLEGVTTPSRLDLAATSIARLVSTASTSSYDEVTHAVEYVDDGL